MAMWFWLVFVSPLENLEALSSSLQIYITLNSFRIDWGSTFLEVIVFIKLWRSNFEIFGWARFIWRSLQDSSWCWEGHLMHFYVCTDREPNSLAMRFQLVIGSTLEYLEAFKEATIYNWLGDHDNNLQLKIECFFKVSLSCCRRFNQFFCSRPFLINKI